MNKAQILYDQKRRDVLFCKSCDSECEERLTCESCHEPGCSHCLKENEVGEKLCEECFNRDEKHVQCQHCLGHVKARFIETNILCYECRNSLIQAPFLKNDVKLLLDTLKDVLNDTDLEVAHGRAQAALNLVKKTETGERRCEENCERQGER